MLEQVTRLREACFQLFGYRVDMASEASKAAAPDTTFVLRPRYGEPGAELMFQSAESGAMTLLPTAFTSQKDVAQQVTVYLERCAP